MLLAQGGVAEEPGHTVVLTDDTTHGENSTLPGSGVVSDEGLILEPGSRVGRYEILERVGAGGMGVVYAGHDPELQRRVAIKMLRPRTGEGPGSAGRTRLLREAQAMAKLSHPNVVAVYDVGLHADRVYVAMEFVDGRTITRWVKEAPRSVAEIVDVFLAAGRGLAAAHEAGFVHRDFKPDNVLVDRTGRVLVMDFGLARATGPNNTTTYETRDLGGLPDFGGDILSSPLTHDGTVVGTPAYMSPEQHMGRAPDAASDQYAYCVSLFEALAGQRPFTGENLRDLALAKTGRAIVRSEAMSEPLRRVLVRGLDPNARARWPSMDALLEVLRTVARPRPRMGGALVGGAVALGLGGVGLAAAWPAGEDEALCDDDKLAGVWDDDRKSAVHDAIEATGVAYAGQTWSRVEQRLDEHAERWRHEYAQACAAMASRDDASTVDLRMSCLEQRRAELRATVDLLAEVDATAVQHAVAQASGLSAIEHCSDLVALRGDVQPPGDAATAVAVEQLRQELHAVRALERAGRFADALARAREILERTAAVDYPPLRAEALVRVAAALGGMGQFREAEPVLREASDLAASIGYDELAADAATRLVYIVGMEPERSDEALAWSRHAEAALARWANTSDEGELARARLQSNVAIVHGAMGRYDDELAAMQQAFEVKRRILGDEHPEVAGAIENVGLALAHVGRIPEARETFAESHALFRRALGDDHPDVALSAANLAQAQGDMGDHAGAEALFEEARRIWAATRGEDSVEVGRALDSLGTMAGAQGRYENALELHERALAIFEQQLGADSPAVAFTHANMGLAHRAMRRFDEARKMFATAAQIAARAYGKDHDFTAALLNDEGEALVELGRYDEAERVLEEALTIRERVLSPDHPAFASSFNTLGQLHGMQGRWAEARRFHERGLEVAERAFGPDHPEAAASRLDLGYVALELDEPEEALDQMKRVVTILEPLDVEPAFEAEGRFGLAQAMIAAGKDRAQALEQARLAQQAFAAGGPYLAEDRERVEAWLDEHAR
jgi:tetratricopeptide (TPR) repeat protein/predicted Ser/Thr protein kinase